MNTLPKTLIAASLFVVTLGGCNCVKVMLGKAPIARGASRLTVQNAGVVMSMMMRDTDCGFASAGVLDAAQVEGEIGKPGGKMTLTVTDCEIDLGEFFQAIPVPEERGEGHQPMEDCQGVRTLGKGKVRVSGTFELKGSVAGNREQPIVPLSPDAAFVHLDVEFTDFAVHSSNNLDYLEWTNGSISYDVIPYLAADNGMGVCSIPTNNLTLKNIEYGPSTVFMDAQGTQAEIPIERSSFEVQVGAYGDRENSISGEILVWQDHLIEIGSEDPALDPNYDADEYLSTYSCNPQLQRPISYECGSLTPSLAAGTGPLTARTFGHVVKALEADENCGFASDEVRNNVSVDGEVGREEASVTWTIDSACELDFGDQPVQIGTADCRGVTETLTGRVRVTGTKTIRGIATGNAAEPVVPTSRDAVEISLSMEFDHLTARSSERPEFMRINSGSLEGTLRPRLGRSKARGVCSIPSNNVAMEGMVLSDADVLLFAEDRHFALQIERTEFAAVSGIYDDHENWIDGVSVVDGVEYPIPADGEPVVLDPYYSPEIERAKMACVSDYQPVRSDSDCSINQLLAMGAARLIVQTTGTIAGGISNNDSCGFGMGNRRLLMRPTQVVGRPPGRGSISWETDGACTIGPGTRREPTREASVERDCYGAETKWTGNAQVQAGRTVEGIRETIDIPEFCSGLCGFVQRLLLPEEIASIVPDNPNAVHLYLRSVELNDFSSFQVPADGGEPQGILTFINGNLSGEVHPVLGESRSSRGRYDVPQPIAVMNDIRVSDAQVVLESEGNTFRFTIGDSLLQATNGPVGGSENTISGWIEIDGERIDLDTMDLNPQYDDEDFHNTYCCKDDLNWSHQAPRCETR